MWRRCGILFAAPLVLALWAYAGPITYAGQLLDGVPVTGVIYQGYGQYSNPVGAVYYSFYANAGASVVVDGDRLVGAYDMSFWVFQGLFSDTSQFGPSFDSSDPGYIDFADDEDPPNLPGPFGDPRSQFTAPVTGWYTVAVTNFLSAGNPPYDFRLTATGVAGVIPEPATAGLLGLGVAGLLVFGRRKR